MSDGIKLVYDRKQYDRTRQMPGKWDLASYRYKFDTTMYIPFLEKLKEKKLIGLKCRGCNAVYFPPKTVCGKCLIVPDKWVPLRDTGVVATYTATYKKDPKTGKQVPEPVIAVRIDGADTTHTIELQGIAFDDVYVGLPVKIKFRDVTKGTLDDIECCVPIEDPTASFPLFSEEAPQLGAAPSKPAAAPASAPTAGAAPTTKAAPAAAPAVKAEAVPAKRAAKKAAKKGAKKAVKKGA